MRAFVISLLAVPAVLLPLGLAMAQEAEGGDAETPTESSQQPGLTMQQLSPRAEDGPSDNAQFNANWRNANEVHQSQEQQANREELQQNYERAGGYTPNVFTYTPKSAPNWHIAPTYNNGTVGGRVTYAPKYAR